MDTRKNNMVFLTMMSELGAGTRGSSLGFQALEIAAINKGITVFRDQTVIELPTQNNLLYKEIETPWAMRMEGIEIVLNDLMNEVNDQLEQGVFPFVISGDHSNAAGTIAGIKKQFPDKRLGIVWIDAHGDLHTPYTSPSGNMHGMPLAISLGADNLKNARNQPKEITKKKWESLKNLGGISPKVNPEDLVFFAVRDTEAPEDNLMAELNIKNYPVRELRERGLLECLAEAEQRLLDCDILYISFDVDSMDCDLVSMGTGTPVKDGLTPNEAEQIIIHFFKLEKTKVIEFVEINPLLDNKCNAMAEASLDILVSAMKTIS